MIGTRKNTGSGSPTNTADCDNYQQSFGWYTTSYSAPSYLPVPQPQVFLPSEQAQVSQANFASLPVTTQPAVRPFDPAALPVFRNAEQYQQQLTLASHLYPGSTKRPHLSGPLGPGSFGLMTPTVASQKQSQVVQTTPTPRAYASD
ncbi:hypothetical protein Nepgr_029095 [Nepenthes gracilis]|uniref:Uncharacterized protein n=1 Tax=Nepenthes gracilis TaxID=150966 RepID=A0AAD3Y2P7_NEPGR|nr:hypothetical protein Nepgr_029095 [Nepenthes gracilis]